MGLGVVRRRQSGVRVRRHGVACVGDHFAGSGLFHSDPHALFALLGYGAEASHRLRFVFHLIRCESVDRRRKNQIALSIYHSFIHSYRDRVWDKQNKTHGNNSRAEARASRAPRAPTLPAIAAAALPPSLPHRAALSLPTRGSGRRPRYSRSNA